MANVINLTLPPPRKRPPQRNAVTRGELLAGYTLEFALQAPDFYHAFVVNIGQAMEKEREALK